MKKCIQFIIVLFFLTFVVGCSTQETVEVTETQIQYDWMVGESPISSQRTGLFRSGLCIVDHEVTSSGTYFVYNDYILYSDDNSDSVIKLCGRADCTHNNTDCNAYIEDGSQISCYEGYLYAVTGNLSEEECKLIRMNLDGSNRIEMLDLLEFAKENGGDYVDCSLITQGYLVFSTYYWAQQEDDSFSGTWLEYYTYKLDGSAGDPKAVDSPGWYLYNCGDVILTYLSEAENGGEYGSFWNWDIENDTLTYLCDHPGTPGYFDEENGYYYREGAVRCLNYQTQTETTLIDTGLEGDYYALFLPDCIVVVSRDKVSEGADDNLYIYNWAYELVDSIKLDYPKDDELRMEYTIIAETAERIVLTDSFQGIPRYYIEKAELGTGEIKVYAYNLPDFQ